MDVNSKIRERMQQLNAEQNPDPAGQENQQIEPQNPQGSPNPNNVNTDAPPKVEIGDSDILSYLKENKGVDISSIDDLLKKPEPFQFASPEVEALNIYVSETNRGLNDYMSVNQDRSNLSDLEYAREYYLQKNPTLTNEDFNSLFDIDLQPLNPEDYDQATVDSTDRAIKKRDAQLKLMANEGRDYFKQLQDKLKQPIERANEQQTLVEQGAKQWMESVSSVAKEFNLGIEGYDHRVTPEQLTEKYSGPDKILDLFRTEQGLVDYSKLMQTIEIGLNFKDISNVLTQKASDATTERLVTEMENPSSSKPNNPIIEQNADVEKMKKQILEFYKQRR